MPATTTAALSQQARAFCAQILPKVSRSFALSISALPAELRPAVGTAYLLCRIVDTVEDDRNLATETRERLFDRFDSMINNCSRSEAERFAQEAGHTVKASDAESALCAGAPLVVAALSDLPANVQQAIVPSVLEMSSGMRDYCRRASEEGGINIRDMTDLERYCYYVAGTVGNLLTRLFHLVVPGLDAGTLAELRKRAVAFGLGLQMVNIVKDVLEDAARGDHFLPGDHLRDEGISASAVALPDSRQGVKRVVDSVCARARQHLHRAIEYTLLWPAPSGSAVRLFCAVPLGLAFATLREVERGIGVLTPGEKPKVSRAFTMGLFKQAVDSVANDAQLRSLLTELAEEPA